MKTSCKAFTAAYCSTSGGRCTHFAASPKAKRALICGASSVALNEVRRRNLVLRSPDGELPDPPVEDSLLQQILERLSLDDALDRVLRGRNKDRNMLAFKMHVYEGCNAAEIAGILGMNVTPRAVENQLSRMRTKLQKFLGLD